MAVFGGVRGLSVCRLYRCVLDVCCDLLQVLGEHLLDLVDDVVTQLFSSAEQLFQRLSQSFPTPSPYPDPDTPELIPPQLPPPPPTARPHTSTPLPPTVTRDQGGHVTEAPLDLSLGHVRSTSSQVIDTLVNQPKYTDRLDWNQHSHDSPQVTGPRERTLYSTKSTERLDSTSSSPSVTAASRHNSELTARRTEISLQRSGVPKTTDTRLQSAPVTSGRPARAVRRFTPAAAAAAGGDVGPRGLLNGGNLCFVSCLLQSLAVIRELVTAVQWAAAKRRQMSSSDSDTSLMSSLSDVLTALHQPSSSRQTPVNPERLIAAFSMTTDCGMIDRRGHSQRQQDAAEFLTWLIHLLRPRLVTDTRHTTGLSVRLSVSFCSLSYISNIIVLSL